MPKALLIRTDGSRKDVTVSALGDYQKAVGGYVERVTLNNGCMIWLDEEGKLKGKPRNDVATIIAFRFKSGMHPDDFIVGDILVTGPEDGDGDLTDLPGSMRYSCMVVCKP